MTDWRNLGANFPVSKSATEPAPLPVDFKGGLYMNCLMDRSTVMNTWQYIYSYKAGNMNDCGWMFYVIPDAPETQEWLAFCQRMYADFGLNPETDRPQDWWTAYHAEYPRTGYHLRRPVLDSYDIEQRHNAARGIAYNVMTAGRYCTQEEIDQIDALVADEKPDSYAGMALNTESWRRGMNNLDYPQECSDFVDVESQQDLSYLNERPQDLFMVQGHTYVFSVSHITNFWMDADGTHEFAFYKDEAMTTKMTTGVTFSGADRVGQLGAKYTVKPTSKTPRTFYCGVGVGAASKVTVVSTLADLPA